MFELKDCPGARALVEYLKQQIQLFDDLEYKNDVHKRKFLQNRYMNVIIYIRIIKRWRVND